MTLNLLKSTKKYSGTCLQGYVSVSYAKLVELFGLPHSHGDGYKVDAQWCFELSSGNIVTIYNYKDGKNYNGMSGLAVDEITEWHIGGNTLNVNDELQLISGLQIRRW